MDIEQIETAAMALSEEDRARLADMLLFSLDRRTVEEIENAWTSEAILRSAQLDNGEVQTVLSEEVSAEAEQIIAE